MDTDVPDLLKSVGRVLAFRVLAHLVEAGECDIHAIHGALGGSQPALQVLLVNLYRQGLVLRRESEVQHCTGRRPYLYRASKTLSRWLQLTSRMAAQMKAGAP